MAAETLGQQLKRDREQLQALLERLAESSVVSKVLEKVVENNGQTGQPFLFSTQKDIPPVLKGKRISNNVKEVLVALKEGLEARGIHLMVVLVPTQVTTHTHRLNDAIEANQDLMPHYTQSLIELVDAGVEVLDLRQTYAEAAGKGKIPIIHPADHHWAGGGIEIAAKQLATRILRIPELQSLESKKADWVRQEVKMDTPHLLLWAKGNNLWGNRGNNYVYSTRSEAIQANGIPEQELTIRYTYRGSEKLRGHRAFGPMKGASLDHPVVVIGDCNAHHKANRTHGGGLAQHLSAQLGWLTTYFATPGGVNRIPSDFVKNQLPKLTRTRVVVLVGRLSDFSSNGWRMPVFEEPEEKPVKEKSMGRFKVALSEVAPLPDPNTADYKDALIASVATITQGPRKGDKIKVITRAMTNRKLTQGIQSWKNGNELELQVYAWATAREKHPGIDGIMVLDEVEDLMLTEH